MLSHGGRETPGLGMGVESVSEGRFFDQLNFISGQHIQGEADGVILGSGVARALGAKLGDDISVLVTTVPGSLNTLDFKVVGIFEIGARDIDDRFFQIEFSTAQLLMDTTSVEGVAVALAADNGWNSFRNQIQSQDASIEAIAFEELDWMYYGNSIKWLGSQMALFQSILVFVVYLGIVQSLTNLVLSRKEEFAFMRANGESKIRIFGTLVTEASLLCMGGAIFGFVLYYSLANTVLRNGLQLPPPPGFTRPMDYKMLTSFSDLPVMLLVVWGIGVVATIGAAFKVLRLDISASLREGAIE